MLEKEAFALLTRKTWNMLTENTEFSPVVTKTINMLQPKQFRENVARVVLQAMTKTLQRTVTPAPGESGEDFIDSVALAFAYLAEDDRPPKYEGFTPHDFAETLITRFCCGYAVLDSDAPTDDVLPDCRITLTIPTQSLAALSLRERLRTMPATAFGQYSLKN